VGYTENTLAGAVLMDYHRNNDNEPGYNVLPACFDMEEVETVCYDTKQKNTGERTPDTAPTTDKRRTAYHDGSDTLKLETCSHSR